MIRLQLLWTSLRSAVAFIQRYRDRQAATKQHAADILASERADQRLLIEGILLRLEGILKVKDESLVEMARASVAQSAAFSQWLASFNHTPTEAAQPSPDASHGDEWEPAIDLLPAEFRLAALLHQTDPGAQTP